jgi:hypothetical protein
MVSNSMVFEIVAANMPNSRFALYAKVGYVCGHVWTGLPSRRMRKTLGPAALPQEGDRRPDSRKGTP